MCNIWDALKEAGQCAKAVCCCLICMICAGPILLIIGIVMIVSPNHRSDYVKQYNDAVKQYNSGPIQSWNGTIRSVPISVLSEKVEIKGSSDGVDPATSYFAQANVQNSPSPVEFNITSVKPFSLSGIQFKKTKSKNANCDNKKGCTASSMASYCTRKYGNSARYQGSGCSTSGTCGTCQYDTYLQTYCAVAASISSTVDQFKYQEDSEKKSCFYPFGASNQIYTSNTVLSVAFQLRASDDPFIALQRITSGSKDFGMSSKDQRLTGLVLLIIGVVIIACISLVVYIVYRLVKGRNSNQIDPSSPPNNYPQQYPNQNYAPPPPQPPYSGYPNPDQGGYYQQQPPYYPPQQPPQPQGYGYGAPPQQPPPSQGYGYGYNN